MFREVGNVYKRHLIVTGVPTPAGKMPRNIKVPEGCRLRLVSENNLTVARMRKATEVAKKRFFATSVAFRIRATVRLFSETRRRRQPSGTLMFLGIFPAGVGTPVTIRCLLYTFPTSRNTGETQTPPYY